MQTNRLVFTRRAATILAMLSVSIALVACAAVADRTTAIKDKISAALRQVHEPDEKTPHALMRISTNVATTVMPGQTCKAWASPRTGIAVSAGSIQLGSFGVAGQLRGVAGDTPKGFVSGELRLTAGEPHVLFNIVQWAARPKAYTCEIARSFVPVAGAHYQMLPIIDRESNRCGLAVMQLLPTLAPVETAHAPDCPTR